MNNQANAARGKHNAPAEQLAHAAGAVAKGFFRSPLRGHKENCRGNATICMRAPPPIGDHEHEGQHRLYID
jgi:hypothetical protein